jgi:WD40 repeat protein
LATVSYVESNKSSTKWKVAIWDPRNGKETASFHFEEVFEPTYTPLLYTPYVFHVVFSPDGKRIAVQANKQVLLHDAASGAKVQTLPGNASGPLAWSPDNQRLATLGINDSQRPVVKVWHAGTGTLRRSINDRQGGIQALLWSPDGKRLLTGGRNNTIKVWDMETGGELLTMPGPSGQLLWANDGKRLLSNGLGGPKVWEVGGYDGAARGRTEQVKKK